MSIFSALYWKIKAAQARALMAKIKFLLNVFFDEVKKIALAVVVFQFLLAFGYWGMVQKGWDRYFGQGEKQVIYISHAQEKEDPKEEIIDPEKRVNDLVDKIYLLESSNGTANYSKCAAIGKVNRIGYGIPGDGTYQCFDSPREELETLKRWLNDKISKGMTDNSILCYYNSGVKTESCGYLK